MGKKIKVVLSGSGTRYPTHLGGIIRLLEEGYEIEEICGTSGGAIIAAGIAAGYDPRAELVDIVKKLLPIKDKKLIDYSIISLIFRWGFIRGDRIGELFKEYAPPCFGHTEIPLHVVTTNINRRAARVFSTAKTPDMCVATAVRASMSIPGVFAPVKIDNELYVDGGLTGNFMLDIFGSGENVIGLRFGSAQRLADYESTNVREIKGVADYIDANIEAMIYATMREHVEDAIFARTVLLNTEHKGLNFKMTEDDVDEMIKDGYNSVDKWLKENN